MGAQLKLGWIAGAGVIVLAALVVLQFWGQQQAPGDAPRLVKNNAAALLAATPEAAVRAEPAPTAVARIAVDVIGAVQQPGVVWLATGARVDDAVRAAGGLAPDADREAINMAAAVADGQQIRVPRVGEASSAEAPVTAESRAADSLIDINTADAAALDALPGIGPATAEAIVSYRAQNGAFKQIDDIEDVKGIGPSLLAQIRDKITVGP